MKATFPYLGYDTYALKTFVEDLGVEVVLPPATSKRTLELGVEHSPELWTLAESSLGIGCELVVADRWQLPPCKHLSTIWHGMTPTTRHGPDCSRPIGYLLGL